MISITKRGKYASFCQAFLLRVIYQNKGYRNQLLLNAQEKGLPT